MAISIRERNNYPWEYDKTYDVFFFGENIFTTVTNNPAKVSDWISDVRSVNGFMLHPLIVGLDVEWRPPFGRQRNPVGTLQLCVGSRCLIYQILHSPGIPPSLIDFLSDNYNVFVGVGIKPDLEKLETDYGIGGNARYVDLGELAARAYGRNDLRNAGLKTLTSFVLGREVEKPQSVRVGEWDNRWLTAAQVQYACLDAFVSYEIGRNLNAASCYY